MIDHHLLASVIAAVKVVVVALGLEGERDNRLRAPHLLASVVAAVKVPPIDHHLLAFGVTRTPKPDGRC